MDSKVPSTFHGAPTMDRRRTEVGLSDTASLSLIRQWQTLEHHRQPGNLDDPFGRTTGIAIVRGAIASSIRRVMKLHLQGNEMFRKVGHAESMLESGVDA